MINLQDLVKYMLEGAAVALAAFYIPQRKGDLKEIAIIALTAALTFAILDQFAPGIAAGTRQGAGFGIGYNITNGLEGFEDQDSGLRSCVSSCLNSPADVEPVNGNDTSDDLEAFYGDAIEGETNTRPIKQSPDSMHATPEDDEHNSNHRDNTPQPVADDADSFVSGPAPV